MISNTSVIGDLQDRTLWPDDRIQETIRKYSGTQICYMQGDDCSYRTLNETGARVISYSNRTLIGCPRHADLFVAIEAGSRSERMSVLRENLSREAKRRAEIKREEERVDLLFRDYLARHISIRDAVDQNLVTDEHIDTRIKLMTAEQIATVKTMLTAQSERVRRIG